MISHFTIFGERCSGTNFLESAILENFKIKHKGDRKIEALLPTDLNYLIQNNIISMNYFKIENPIYGITYPGDEKHMKLIISLYGM